jgi:sec-independent protein translocase protein TatC
MALVPFPSDDREDPPVRRPAPVVDDPEPDDEEPLEGGMTFLEHLDELRKRITRAVASLLVGFLLAFAFIEPIHAFVYARLVAEIPGGTLVFTEPMEGFFIYIKIAALSGLFIASPYIMWQVWLFIAPGLYANEKRLAVPFVLVGSALFIGGAAFSHWVLFPAAWRFFASFSNEYTTFMPRIEPVFALYVKLMLALGLVFQMPMLVFVLAKLGLVTARFLIDNLKYAILIIFIVAAIVTPDGSMVVQVIMAAPMIVLYFVSIGVAWLFGRGPRAETAADG